MRTVGPLERSHSICCLVVFAHEGFVIALASILSHVLFSKQAGISWSVGRSPNETPLIGLLELLPML